MDALDQWIGPVLTGGLTLGGVWIVLRLIIGFQRDFSDEYAARLQRQEQRIRELETEVSMLRERLRDAEDRRP